MKVTVRSVGLLSPLLGSRELEVVVPPDCRLDGLLRHLGESGGPELAAHLAAVNDHRSIPPALRVLVNGRDIGALDGVGTQLAEGDDILIMTPLAGG